MHRTSLRGGTVAALLTASLLAAPAAAVAPPDGPELRLDPPSTGLLPNEEHDVVGSGFALPTPVETCEVRWDGTEVSGSECGVLDGVEASLPVPTDADTAQDHEVTVCVPDCRHPWAGSARATIELRDPPVVEEEEGEEQPDGGPVDETTDGSTDDTSDQPPSVPDPVPSPGTVEPLPGPVPPPPPVLGLAAGSRFALAVSPPEEPTLDVLSEGALYAGDTLAVRAPTLPQLSDDCVLTWEREPLGSCRADPAGNLAGRVVVPATALAGSYEVIACRPTCNAPVGGSAPVVVTVLAVPGPVNGTEVPPAEAVSVPDLTGLTLEQVTELLQNSGLGLGEATGSGLVTGQEPLAGARRPPGSPVDVALGAVPPPPRVAVPLLVGGTVAEAGVALAAAGLAATGLPESASPDAQVAAQEPTAGTLVGKGSLVEVELAAAPAPGAGRWLLGLLIAFLAVAAGVVTSLVASRVRAHPHTPGPTAELVPLPDPRPEVVVQVRRGVPAPLPLQLAAHRDSRPHVTTEVRT